MKKFIITETRPAIQILTFEVEAENQNEALEMVLSEMNEADAVESDIEINYDADDVTYDIEEY